MKRFTKRGLSMVLVLALCISLLSGLSFVSSAATVDYTYGSYEKFTDVIYNWGARGDTATFLSPNAEDYYENRGISYEDLAALAGSTDTDATDSALYAQLKKLMTESMTEIDYDDARGLLAFTDCELRGNVISCFYSAGPLGPQWDGGATWNREHVWPQSKIKDDADEDIMMLRPANARLNSGRNNKAYGNSANYYNPNGNFGTASYDIRGDVARTLLYGYVRWDNTQYMWGESGVIESLDVLLAWVAADPVDTWEMGRNDAVESINGCRNVFVDYPELAFELFEEEIPQNMKTPSTGISYDVKAVSSNNAQGTVKVAGNVINAYPAYGYEIAGYRVTSGNATVTIRDNVLVVEAASDCTIAVDFQMRGNKTVEFMVNGKQVKTENVRAGNSITLPGSELAALEGYNFAGWVTEEITELTTSAPAAYSAGTQYTVETDVRLYALFSCEREDTTGGKSFALYSGELTTGEYVITYGNFAMSTSKSSNKLRGTAISPVNNVINTPATSIVWTITVSGDTAMIYNSAVKYVTGSTANNANLTFSREEGWIIEKGEKGYAFINPSVKTRALCFNASADYFGNYAISSYDEYLQLYKLSGAATYYTTGAKAQEANVVELWQDDVLVGSYTTLAAALAAANDGTLALLADINADNVIVKPGVTLDLNGNTLTADLLVAMDGAIVCDSANRGSIKISKGNFVLAKDNGNVIPVWNGTDGYIFTRVTFQQMNAGNGKYIFLPSFSNAAVVDLLADGGLDNALVIKVCLTWNDGYSQQFYTYSDDLLKQVYDGTNRLAFDLTVTGIAGITDLVASPVVVTNAATQATALGLTLTA